ncbi:MAG: bis-aminopropyl spermidine synthase family protein [Segniliparus sp.]|uniref:bis-aminopropyl spermidine synthase family protein n=1 Tax=Segniliparus sp. TaxID=2804064 RepID=UPI003F3202C7
MALAEVVSLLARRTASNRQHVAALARLWSGEASLQELVEASALSRRGVEELIRTAGEDVVVSSGAGASARWALVPSARDEYAAVLGGTTRPQPDPELVLSLREARARCPKPNTDLDHVAATAKTAVARAAWIARRFETTGLRVLFVGDHDLTSLALARLCPQAEIAVVDVSEPLVEFLAAELHALRPVPSADGLAASFRVRHADLRQRFPVDLEGWADVFVADPPYTPEGVALFCARGAQGLRDLAHGRGLLAYGYGEDQPALGLAVQKAVLGLDCLVEELIPDFNRYHGAQAIGGASDWYVLRFAPSAAKRVGRAVSAAPRAIYTHGRQSVESNADGGAVDSRGVDLRGADSSALFRALLWEDGEQLSFLVDNNHPDLRTADSQARLVADVAGKWNVRFRKSVPDSASAIVEAAAVVEPNARGLALSRPHGKVKNVLREARILAKEGLTKNEARAWVAEILAATQGWGADLGESLAGDVPRAALRALLQGVEEGAG